MVRQARYLPYLNFQLGRDLFHPKSMNYNWKQPNHIYGRNLISLPSNRARDDGTVIPSVPGDSCYVNDWDKDQYCHCPNGHRISNFISSHSNHHEDRKWRLRCSAIQTAGRPLTGNFSASEKFFHFEFWLWLSFRFFYNI